MRMCVLFVEDAENVLPHFSRPSFLGEVVREAAL